MPESTIPAVGWLAVAVVFGPDAAFAHAPVEGLMGFYTGLAHPFLSAGPLLALTALGLFLAVNCPDRATAPLAAFTAGTLAGLIGGLLLGPTPDPTAALLLLATVAAVCGALAPRSWLAIAIAIATIGGILSGVDATPDPGPLRDRLMTGAGGFFGASIGLPVIAGGVALLVDRIDRPWTGVMLRIGCAWTAAIASLMLALIATGSRTEPDSRQEIATPRFRSAAVAEIVAPIRRRAPAAGSEPTGWP